MSTVGLQVPLLVLQLQNKADRLPLEPTWAAFSGTVPTWDGWCLAGYAPEPDTVLAVWRREDAVLRSMSSLFGLDGCTVTKEIVVRVPSRCGHEPGWTSECCKWLIGDALTVGQAVAEGRITETGALHNPIGSLNIRDWGLPPPERRHRW